MTNKIHKILLLILFALIFMSQLQPAYAQTGPTRHFIILVVDQISLNNLDHPDLAHFQALIQKNGAIGLMNTTTGGSQTADNAFTTIGSGSRAIGSPGAAQSFNTRETINGQLVADIYQRRNNIRDIHAYQVVNLSAEQMKNMNKDKHYEVRIGALGDALHEAGLKTAVLGNSDLPSEETNLPRYTYGRQAAALLMDGNGRVDYGVVSGDILTADRQAPFGIRTDEEKLLKLLKQYYTQSPVLVVDFGDTSRAAAYSSSISKPMAERQLYSALHRADHFLGELLQVINLEQDYLMVLTPTPSEANKAQGNTLTPLIFAGPGIEKGLLTSGTTHRPGIVTNTDVAATVLHSLGLAVSEEMIGQPMKGISAETGSYLQYLSQAQEKLVQNTLRRVPVLSTVASYILGVLALSLVMFILRLFNHDYSRILKKILLYNYLAILTLPLGLLAMAGLGALTVAQSFMALILITFVLTVLLHRLARNKSLSHAMVAVCAAFIALLFTDLFLGANLILNSPLGYDPQYGARFYGIGNELMGAVIGAATLGAAAFMNIKQFKGRLVLVAAMMLGVLFVMVYPGLGSKGGASISVTAAFVTLLWLSLGLPTGKKQLFMVAASVLAVMLFISLADFLGGSRTHIGRAVQEIQTGGLSSMLDIIIRKLEMDFRLMRYSYWSGMLVASIFLMLLMFKFQFDFLEHIRKRTPDILNGCYAALFGAAVALFTNDAGIIAAATAIIYPIFTLLLLNLVPSDKTSQNSI
ncbi:hypothetical protein [Desulforamulus ruminis]|uniref:Type I phosphodiesterase/nucleotide pyrophosphatase n=1 Tax=Desulforamulus ruminis (strain ATCC 23193 / DSM 2154 / NCIMB 8452 / DL) TaxID=696281 RepID=F6DRM4_DESRL|nr:hypothetical protein [Desulforamulus ruminis]AEG58778.1 hypothetical protein Desru_0492 [Desulforamulus ruminis DSM 2154]